MRGYRPPTRNLTVQQESWRPRDAPRSAAKRKPGATTSGPTELAIVLDFIRHGDVLMVTRIDRLARSIGDLQDIVRKLKEKSASLKATEQPIDT
jgi:hypothetical protein